MAAEWLLTTQFLAAGAMVVLALWLLWLDFNSRVVRAFAVFLVVRGAHIAANQMAVAVDDAAWRAVWEQVRWVYALAVVPALASFLIVYVWPRPTRATRVARTATLGLAVVAVLVYFSDPCLARCTTEPGLIAFGPLSLLVADVAVAYGLAALWLSREACTTSPGPKRDAVTMVAVGLVLNALLEAGLGLVFLAGNGFSTTFSGAQPSSLVSALYVVNILGLVPAALAVALLARGRAPPIAGRRMLYLGFAIGALALTLVVIEWGPSMLGTPNEFGRSLIGSWRLALPILAAYAIVRYRLFGLEVKLNGSFGHGTVAASFVAVFFTTSEMAQQFFSARVGPFLGIVAAGFLVFAIAPLEKLGRGFAHRLMGTPASTATMAPAERLSLFREQAAIAWQDGALTRRERMLLEQLRERLGLTPEEATRLEGEAVRMEAGVGEPGSASAAQTKGLS